MGSASRVKPKKLPDKLLAIRQFLGYTGQEMAAKLSDSEIKVQRTDIPRFEKGIREPSLIVLLRYAKLVKISTDDLIDDKTDLLNNLTK
jgi:DNA-binding XRE family transcriptional regulator